MERIQDSETSLEIGCPSHPPERVLLGKKGSKYPYFKCGDLTEEKTLPTLSQRKGMSGIREKSSCHPGGQSRNGGMTYKSRNERGNSHVHTLNSGFIWL